MFQSHDAIMTPGFPQFDLDNRAADAGFKGSATPR